MNKLTIQDGHAKINGDKTTFVCPSDSLCVVGPDGRDLFTIRIVPDEAHSIEVSSFGAIKIKDDVYQHGLLVRPRASNVVIISREPMK